MPRPPALSIRRSFQPNVTIDVIRIALYYSSVIKTFADAPTETLFGGGNPRQLRAFRAVAERKLQMLDSAATIDFLRSPPGNRLERLSGNRRGQWSIRINRQWRLCFRWTDNDAYDVEIVDYH